MMRDTVRTRIAAELAAAVVTATLAVVTAVWSDWIELAFHVDPDHGSGALEWAVVGVSAATCLLVLFAAGRQLARRAYAH